MQENNYPALVSVEDLDSASEFINSLVCFKPEIHARIEAWYDYWDILEANYLKACSEVKKLERRESSKLKIADQALRFAEKFSVNSRKQNKEVLKNSRKQNNETPKSSSGDQNNAVPEKHVIESKLFVSRRNTLSESVERINRIIIEPLEKRLRQLPEIIRTVILETDPEKRESPGNVGFPVLDITSREVVMDPDNESMAYILTTESFEQADTILLCNALTGRIPGKKDFFSMDITSSCASPDGTAWFDDDIRPGFENFDFDTDWAESTELYKQMLDFYEQPMCCVLSHIPIYIDDQAFFRIRHASGFEQIEIFRNGFFDKFLTLEEVSMFAGYLIYLKKQGFLDFTIEDK